MKNKKANTTESHSDQVIDRMNAEREQPGNVMHNYEEWLEKFTPVTNHLDDNASFDYKAFETYGAELDFVKAANPKTVWTVVDADGGLYVIAGFHFVNRVNYFITEQEWTADEEQKEYFIS